MRDGDSKGALVKSFAAALFLHIILFAGLFIVFPDINLKVEKPAHLSMDFIQETVRERTDALIPRQKVLPRKKRILPFKKKKKEADPFEEKPIPKQKEIPVPRPEVSEEKPPVQPSIVQPGGVAETGIKKAAKKKEIDSFLAEILFRIEKAKYYPMVARRKGMTGTITCRFVILRDGGVKNITLINPSKYSLLNRAAVDAVKKGAPYPDFPSFFNEDVFISKVDIKFNLN